MIPTVFFQLMDSTTKGDDLHATVEAVRNGGPVGRRIFIRAIADLNQLDGTPFAYWVERSLLTHIRTLTPFDDEGHGRGTRCGLGTLDDFRFLRLRWEVYQENINTRWMPYFHGGLYSPVADEFPLVANWRLHGREVKVLVESKVGSASRKVQGEDRYLRGGFVFPRRTRAFSPKVMPKGAIFSTAGQCGFAPVEELPWTIALMSSTVVGYLISLSQGAMAKGGGPSPQFEVGLVKRLPWPTPTSQDKAALAASFAALFREKMGVLSTRETFAWYKVPALLRQQCPVNEAITEWQAEVEDVRKRFAHHREQIESIACRLYGLPINGWRTILSDMLGDAVDIDRILAEQCDAFGDGVLDESELTAPDRLCKSVVAHLVGVCFGRWRSVTSFYEGDVVDPFAEIPVLPPAAREAQSPDPTDGESAPRLESYEKFGGGIAVGDASGNEGLASMVSGAISELWGEIDQEAEQTLVRFIGTSSLKRYFAEPTGFFADHLRQHSDARRAAPIYWPLSVPSGEYTLWLCYHRLTDQTLYTCVNDFVDPKLKQVSEEAGRLRGKSNRSSAEEKELERLSDLELELKDFRDALLRIAKFWKPNLNDGVQITAAPLWKLFQHRQWQNRLKETWEKLEAGEYDWAHLALSIWPDRVVRASQADRSYAIAHDLEDQLWHEVEVEKKTRGGKVKKVTEWQPRALSNAEIERIIREVKSR